MLIYTKPGYISGLNNKIHNSTYETRWTKRNQLEYNSVDINGRITFCKVKLWVEVIIICLRQTCLIYYSCLYHSIPILGVKSVVSMLRLFQQDRKRVSRVK